MKEKDIREHIQAFLKNTAQNFVVPASLGIGLAIVGCDNSPLSSNSDASSLQPRTGGATGGGISGAGGALYGIPTGGNRGTGGMIYGTGGFSPTGGATGGGPPGTGGSLPRTGGIGIGGSGAGGIGTVYGTGGFVPRTGGISGAGGTVYGTGGFVPRTGGSRLDAGSGPDVSQNDGAPVQDTSTRETGDAETADAKDGLPGEVK